MHFRYAERDHEQLISLYQKRALLASAGQKKSTQAEEPAEAFQIFVEMPTNPKKTATLMVRSKTTVGEVKAMVAAKEGGIPVERQRLRTRNGKCLWPEEQTLDSYHIGREATLSLLS